MRTLLSVVLFSALTASAQPAAWTLDTGKSELVVKVWKTGAAAGLAHDHVVRASKFEGKVLSLDDTGKLETLALEVTVPVADLVPDEPEARKRYGVTGPLVPDGDREKVKENMLGAEQLEAKKFPTITFRSTRVYREESGVIECEGDLTLHGVKKPVVFPLTVKTGDRVMEGDAKFRVRTSDFGVKPYSTALGLIKNRDEVEFVLHLVVTR